MGNTFLSEIYVTLLVEYVNFEENIFVKNSVFLINKPHHNAHLGSFAQYWLSLRKDMMCDVCDSWKKELFSFSAFLWQQALFSCPRKLTFRLGGVLQSDSISLFVAQTALFLAQICHEVCYFFCCWLLTCYSVELILVFFVRLFDLRLLAAACDCGTP